MSDVPDEIILEILSRLPVKSLCRFRCVSKPWRTLITDHEFVKKHLNLVKKHEPLKSMRLMMQQYSSYIKSCSLDTLFHQSPCLAIELNHPQKNLRHRIVVVGSCNGLVCFVISKTDSITMFIWNPTTRESISCQQPLSKCRATLLMMGFGYDCSTDDYIAVLELIACDDNGALKRVVGVFSMRTKSWRMIERVDYCVRGRGLGKLVNGALHWVGTCRGEDDDQLILSLDLVDLVFREVPKPYNYGCDRTIIYVQVFGESLGILCNRPGSYVVDLWIMKDYGVKESWTKLLTLQCPQEMNRFNYSRSLCFSKNGVILTFSGRKLVLYDINKNTFTCPSVDGDHINCEVEIFMETLVSPNAYCEQGEDPTT